MCEILKATVTTTTAFLGPPPPHGFPQWDFVNLGLSRAVVAGDAEEMHEMKLCVYF
jgi:hypothetical protein